MRHFAGEALAERLPVRVAVASAPGVEAREEAARIVSRSRPAGIRHQRLPADRPPAALDAPFVVTGSRAREAGLERVVRDERLHPCGQLPRRPDQHRVRSAAACPASSPRRRPGARPDTSCTDRTRGVAPRARPRTRGCAREVAPDPYSGTRRARAPRGETSSLRPAPGAGSSHLLHQQHLLRKLGPLGPATSAAVGVGQFRSGATRPGADTGGVLTATTTRRRTRPSPGPRGAGRRAARADGSTTRSPLPPVRAPGWRTARGTDWSATSPRRGGSARRTAATGIPTARRRAPG